MPELNVKSYQQAVDTTQKIIHGLKTHKGEADFPSIVKEEVLSAMMRKLIDVRESYEELNARTKRTHEEYNRQMETLKVELSKCKTMIYAFYGKNSKVVLDFGLIPFKTKVKPAANAPGESNTAESIEPVSSGGESGKADAA